MPYYVKKQIPIKAEQQDKPFITPTLEGVLEGKVGDYLVTGIKGETYPCAKDIFEETYYEVTEDVYNEYYKKRLLDSKQSTSNTDTSNNDLTIATIIIDE